MADWLSRRSYAASAPDSKMYNLLHLESDKNWRKRTWMKKMSQCKFYQRFFLINNKQLNTHTCCRTIPAVRQIMELNYLGKSATFTIPNVWKTQTQKLRSSSQLYWGLLKRTFFSNRANTDTVLLSGPSSTIRLSGLFEGFTSGTQKMSVLTMSGKSSGKISASFAAKFTLVHSVSIWTWATTLLQFGLKQFNIHSNKHCVLLFLCRHVQLS